MLAFLKGKKTFLVAFATALFGITGFYTGKMPSGEMIEYLLMAAGLVGIRDGMNPPPKKRRKRRKKKAE